MQHAEGFGDIRLLANLFKECDRRGADCDSDEDDDETTVKSSVTPGSIGGGKKKKGKESLYTKVEPKRMTEEEFFKNEEKLIETRVKPSYDISYRQAVGSEDVFLQMGGKTPATMSCEDLIMTIHLPGEERMAVDLNITHTQIELTSPKFKLDMPFPYPVDPQRSNAKWDPETEKLTLTLRMDREMDFVNF